jgi:hypothetical protein
MRPEAPNAPLQQVDASSDATTPSSESVADIADPAPRDRIGKLNATRDQAKSDAQRVTLTIDAVGHPRATEIRRQFAQTARTRLRGPDGGYRRDHRGALSQRVEVANQDVRIVRSKLNSSRL